MHYIIIKTYCLIIRIILSTELKYSYLHTVALTVNTFHLFIIHNFNIKTLIFEAAFVAFWIFYICTLNISVDVHSELAYPVAIFINKELYTNIIVI